MTDTVEVTDAKDWRQEALDWIGREVRIMDGPSYDSSREKPETGIVICVDATDYRPAAWVKITRKRYPDYRSCDLCWLEDALTGESGPAWSKPPDEVGHGLADGAVVMERIRSEDHRITTRQHEAQAEGLVEALRAARSAMQSAYATFYCQNERFESGSDLQKTANQQCDDLFIAVEDADKALAALASWEAGK